MDCKPTSELRWVFRSSPFDMLNEYKILQQKWLYDNGEETWLDVPITEA